MVISPSAIDTRTGVSADAEISNGAPQMQYKLRNRKTIRNLSQCYSAEDGSETAAEPKKKLFKRRNIDANGYVPESAQQLR